MGHRNRARGTPQSLAVLARHNRHDGSTYYDWFRSSGEREARARQESRDAFSEMKREGGARAEMREAA